MGFARDSPHPTGFFHRVSCIYIYVRERYRAVFLRPKKKRTMAANPKNMRVQSRLEKIARESDNLPVDYEVQAKIIREKTARLKALRLAKEAEAQTEEPPLKQPALRPARREK